MIGLPELRCLLLYIYEKSLNHFMGACRVADAKRAFQVSRPEMIRSYI